MRKLILLLGVLLTAATQASAQDSYPSGEIFGGYSYMNAGSLDRESLNGWGGSVAMNLSKRVAFVSDISGHYGNASVQFPGNVGFRFKTSIQTFLFGPRLSARGRKLTGFGHVLVGGARGRVLMSFIGLPDEVDDPEFGKLSFSDTGLAIAAGGGLDLQSSKNVAVRLFQVDYLPVRLNNAWTHTFRVQTGVVFRFGH